MGQAPCPAKPGRGQLPFVADRAISDGAFQCSPRQYNLLGGHVMRNFVIGCIVLFAMAGTAFGEEPKQPPKELTVDLGKGVSWSWS